MFFSRRWMPAPEADRRICLSELLIKNGIFGLCHLERKDEFCTNVLRADDGNCLTVRADDFLDDRETETRSLTVSASGRVALIKAIPDFGQVVAGYASELLSLNLIALSSRL